VKKERPRWCVIGNVLDRENWTSVPVLKKDEIQLFSSFFSLMKRSKNQPTAQNFG